MKRILGLIIVLLLLSSSALADLKKGDRGDAVRDLQTMMIEAGALDDKADGIFGKKTEAAVKSLQTYFGMKKNGRADDRFLLETEDLWRAITGDGTEGGMDEGDLDEIGAYCMPEGQGYCFRHEEAAWVESFLNRNGKKPPEAVQIKLMERACVLWYDYTIAMYDEWEEMLDDEETDAAREQKQIYEEAYSELSGDLADHYRKNRVKELNERLRWLKEMGVQECYDLYGQEANP